MFNKKKDSVAIMGLGYVGHPLALNFGQFIKTIGFDVSKEKIANFKKKKDDSFIFKKKDFSKAKYLSYHSDPKSIKNSKYKIIALPTPVYKNNKPDLSLLKNGCFICAKYLKKNDIVIIESTIYPGATQEILIPILEKNSGMKYNKDFFVAYCPERINPGDKKNDLKKIVKVVSSNNKKTAQEVKNLYSLIIKKIHLAKDLITAESAKIIENTQRDVNIALMNELAMLFSKLNVDIDEVLKTASTKWNFLRFYPGLVGGHCIGVDPYYLKYKADQIKFNSKLITSGRNTNEELPNYVVKKIFNYCKRNNIKIKKINILGATYKENVSDFRNSKVIRIAEIFSKKNILINIHDPYMNKINSYKGKNIKSVNWKNIPEDSEVLIFAVPHDFYKKKTDLQIIKKLKKNCLFFDIRAQIKKSIVNFHNRSYMTL